MSIAEIVKSKFLENKFPEQSNADNQSMQIETADDAIEIYKSFDGWEYADREAAWKWMFKQGWEAGQKVCAKQLENTEQDKSTETNGGCCYAV